jgi:O-antigen ligase
MALSAIFGIVRGRYQRIILISTALSAIWFAGSRSGWISLICIVGAAIYMKAVSFREIVIALVIAAIAACLPLSNQIITTARVFISDQIATSDGGRGSDQGGTSNRTISSDWVGINRTEPVGRPEIVPSALSTRERLFSLVEGWKLFETAPMFGAGLGAFRHLGFEGSSTGIPLLIHSTALWLLAELGVVGFLVFAIPFVRIFLSEAKTCVEEASAVAVLCMVAFVVMATPADMLYQRTFWLVMGAALATYREPATKTYDVGGKVTLVSAGPAQCPLAA